MSSRPSKGGAPCYVSITPDNKHVLVANYSGGNVAVLPILSDGSLGEPSDVAQHTGSSVNEQRQKGPHAHCIVPSPDGRFAFAADLGLDRVMIYRLDSEKGTLEPGEQPSVAVKPGAGPRHFTFHPDGKRAYVINELDSTVVAYTYDAAIGALTETQTVSTLPEDFTGDNYPADIHVSPAGRFVYGSNRGHNSIVVFAIDEYSGALSLVQHQPTGGEWPRNFAIDPSGRFLLVANQNTDNVVVFSIDPETGMLEPADRDLEIPAPVCLRFA
jgi:6-phosphogluconolactonase